MDRAFKDAFDLLVPLGIEQILRKSNTVIMNQFFDETTQI